MSYNKPRKAIVIFTAILFHCLLVFHLLFSPVIIVLASSKGIVNASFFSFIIIFVFSLFFGRAYCAWFCPGCGIQEITGFFVKKKVKNSKAKYIKYFIFFAWMSVIVVGYILKGFTQIDLSFGMADISIQKRLLLTVGAIMFIVPLAIIFGKFASCKYVCWQAPILIIGKRIRDMLHLPGLRIKTNADKCKSCGVCSKSCPMDIDVAKKISCGEIVDDDCILCGSCIDSCKFGALKYCISTPRKAALRK
ncbi:MAG: 4Fe-4S binding protein [Bacillota bacterium]|nr:4Fe-4S binding protein [Bacillota bacterium]